MLGIPWVLGACVSNTITVESDSDETTDDPSTSTSVGPPPPVTTSPGTSPGTSTTTTAGPSSAITTDDPPPPLPDFGPLDSGTDGWDCIPPCDPDEVCLGGMCFDDPGFTTGEECGLVPGQWADCLADDGTPNDVVCQSPDAVCVTDGFDVGGCLFDSCVDACDCPPAPPGSEAQVVCDMLLGDGDGDCYLDCSGGEACPNGMICFMGFVCLFPT